MLQIMNLQNGVPVNITARNNTRSSKLFGSKAFIETDLNSFCRKDILRKLDRRMILQFISSFVKTYAKTIDSINDPDDENMCYLDAAVVHAALNHAFYNKKGEVYKDPDYVARAFNKAFNQEYLLFDDNMLLVDVGSCPISTVAAYVGNRSLRITTSILMRKASLATKKDIDKILDHCPYISKCDDKDDDMFIMRIDTGCLIDIASEMLLQECIVDRINDSFLIEDSGNLVLPSLYSGNYKNGIDVPVDGLIFGNCPNVIHNDKISDSPNFFWITNYMDKENSIRANRPIDRNIYVKFGTMSFETLFDLGFLTSVQDSWILDFNKMLKSYDLNFIVDGDTAGIIVSGNK